MAVQFCLWKRKKQFACEKTIPFRRTTQLNSLLQHIHWRSFFCHLHWKRIFQLINSVEAFLYIRGAAGVLSATDENPIRWWIRKVGPPQTMLFARSEILFLSLRAPKRWMSSFTQRRPRCAAHFSFLVRAPRANKESSDCFLPPQYMFIGLLHLINAAPVQSN